MLFHLLHTAAKRLGYTLQKDNQLSFDYEKDFLDIYDRVKEYTMTSVERIYSVYTATQYIEKSHIAGDIVECGVWRGGSVMAAALRLKALGNVTRNFYLYDTYAGMTKPTFHDRTNYDGADATSMWERYKRDTVVDWCYASKDEVRSNVESTLYPSHKFRLIKGDVLRTIPKEIPKKIALLRLDTDWYESTKHELVHLFPRLVRGGVIIIDDYGHWKGAKTAVDEYFAMHKTKLLLHRVDYTGRVGIKLEG